MHARAPIVLGSLLAWACGGTLEPAPFPTYEPRPIPTRAVVTAPAPPPDTTYVSPTTWAACLEPAPTLPKVRRMFEGLLRPWPRKEPSECTADCEADADPTRCRFDLARCHYLRGAYDRAAPLFAAVAASDAETASVAAVLGLESTAIVSYAEPPRFQCLEIIGMLADPYVDRLCRPFPETSDAQASAVCTALIRTARDVRRLAMEGRW